MPSKRKRTPTLRVRGDVRAYAARQAAQRQSHQDELARCAKGGCIDPHFRGNARAALTVTNTDRTLGASPRQGWRLSSGVRGKNPRHNTAGYIATPDLMTYSDRDAPEGTPVIDRTPPDGIARHNRVTPDPIARQRKTAPVMVSYDGGETWGEK